MMRYTHGVLFGLLTAFGLLMPGTALSDGGTAPAGPLIIDPTTFQSIPPARGADSPLKADRAGPIHVGPRIVLRRPENDSEFRASEPVTVHVEFLPAADGSAPDMATLNVRVRKGWFGKDITEVVEPYVTGPAIQVPKLDFSGHTGNFRFKIRIRDHRDRESEVEFRITVRG